MVLARCRHSANKGSSEQPHLQTALAWQAAHTQLDQEGNACKGAFGDLLVRVRKQTQSCPYNSNNQILW